LSIGIALWQLFHSYEYIVIYTLIVLIVLILWDYVPYRKEVSKLKDKLSDTSDMLSRTESGLSAMLSLVPYITIYPLDDTVHHYFLREEHYIIQGSDATYIWRMHGRNVSSQNSESITLKSVGNGGNISREEINLTVYDEMTNSFYDKKQIQFIQDEPNSKTYRIYFSSPLAPQDEFKMKISCRWNDVFSESKMHDYVFSPGGYICKCGLEKLILRLTIDMPIKDVYIDALEEGQLMRQSSKPRILENDSRHTIVEWTKENPKGIYILHYTKIVVHGKRN